MATVSPSDTFASSVANQAVAKMSDRNKALLSGKSAGILSRFRPAAAAKHTQQLNGQQSAYRLQPKASLDAAKSMQQLAATALLMQHYESRGKRRFHVQEESQLCCASNISYFAAGCKTLCQTSIAACGNAAFVKGVLHCMVHFTKCPNVQATMRQLRTQIRTTKWDKSVGRARGL